jgi:predicted alpha-1,2-mannosidase
MASFTFPSTTQANLIFKLNASANTDSNTQFNVVSSTEVSGQVTSGGFCGASNSYTVYFDMAFNTSFATNGTAAVKAATTAPSEAKNTHTLHGVEPKASSKVQPNLVTPNASANNGYVTFNTTSNQTVLAKIGVSFVSLANATQNRTSENPNWDFASTKSAAHAAWDSLLGKVGIAGGTSAQQTVFYTSLYHASLHPNLISDVNGQYPGFNGSVQSVDSGHTAEYGNFSGWDIYRSQAQLEGLIDPQAASDTAQSMIDDYAQTGLFPKWSENNGETYVMVGDPADSIIADYYAFGARSFDTATALKDMLAEATNSNNDRPGLTYLEQVGYLPSNGSYGCCNFYGPAATTLEYDTADFAVSALAGALGDTSDQTAMATRAQDWQNEFDHNSGFVQPRDYSGTWTSGFSASSQSNFVEADSSIYTPMVPFNVHGLGDGRERGAQHVPQHRAVLVQRRQRIRRLQQRAVARDPLGVRLHRRAVQDAVRHPRDRGPDLDRRSRRARGQRRPRRNERLVRVVRTRHVPGDARHCGPRTRLADVHAGGHHAAERQYPDDQRQRRGGQRALRPVRDLERFRLE